MGREQRWMLKLGKRFFLALAWKLARDTRENLLANAARLLGPQSSLSDRERLARATLSNFYDFVCDIPRSAKMSEAELLARIRSVEGEAAYRELRKSACGAI